MVRDYPCLLATGSFPGTSKYTRRSTPRTSHQRQSIAHVGTASPDGTCDHSSPALDNFAPGAKEPQTKPATLPGVSETAEGACSAAQSESSRHWGRHPHQSPKERGTKATEAVRVPTVPVRLSLRGRENSVRATGPRHSDEQCPVGRHGRHPTRATRKAAAGEHGRERLVGQPRRGGLPAAHINRLESFGHTFFGRSAGAGGY